MKTTRLFDFYG